ncbi:MAG: hypothetical protein IVW51_07770 [Thermaceae bacterium]|nr:hypothetical protein [Thermaceae bacterium]
MVAVKQKVLVQKGGRIELNAPELPEGSTAEVIVLLETNEVLPMLESLLGKARGNFPSPQEADEFTLRERDAWES